MRLSQPTADQFVRSGFPHRSISRFGLTHPWIFQSSSKPRGVTEPIDVTALARDTIDLLPMT
jgi:hypothetical protein